MAHSPQHVAGRTNLSSDDQIDFATPAQNHPAAGGLDLSADDGVDFGASEASFAPTFAASSIPQRSYAPPIVNPTPRKPGWVEDILWRGVAGGLERAITGVAETAFDVVDGLYDMQRQDDATLDKALFAESGQHTKIMTFEGGKFAFVPYDQAKDHTVRRLLDEHKVFDAQIPKSEGGFAKLTQAVVGFAIPFSKTKLALEGAGMFAQWGKFAPLAADVVASGVAAFSSLHPLEGNLANTAHEMGMDRSAFGEATKFNGLVDALSVDKNDDAIMARMKNTAADFTTNLAFAGGFETLARGFKLLRGSQIVDAAGTLTEAAGKTVVAHDASVTHAEVKAHVADQIAAEAGHQADLFPEGGLGVAPAEVHTARPVGDQIDSVESMILNVERKGATMTEGEITELAQQFLGHTQFEGIERIGVNPSRLDFGEWMAKHADPEALRGSIDDLLNRISSSEVGKRLADAMGSAPRTDEAAAFLSKMIGSDVAKVINTFKGKTRNLDVHVRAASALVGGEARKLIVHGEALGEAITRGEFTFDNPAHPAYVAFLKQFETLTTLQAAMRGSFSEMGRGLRSIQMMNAVRTSKEGVELAKSVIKDPAARAAKLKSSWEEKLRQLGDASTPAQRKALFDQVMKANGDLSAVAAAIAKQEGGFKVRGIRALRETSANLFSVGTASATALGMVTNHSLDLIAGLGHGPLAWLTKRDDFLIAAAVNRAKWATVAPAYVNGLTRALQVAGASLIREVGHAAEGAGSAGLKGSMAAEKAAKDWERMMGSVPTLAGDKFGQHASGSVSLRFHREAAMRDPAIYLSASEVDSLMAQADHGPAFLAASARATVGLIVNTFGALTRAGRVMTIEFLDELTGTAVYSAHRYAEAVGVTTEQGLKIGKTGKELSDYAHRNAKVLVSSTSRETAVHLQNAIEAGGGDPARIAQLAEDVIQRHGIEEIAQADARRMLFQDAPTTSIGNAMSKAAKAMDPAGIIAPFVNTPIRILETGIMDYSPVGLFKKQLREDLRSNGPKATEALVKMGMGTSVLLMGYNMAANGSLVGYDGGFKSSSRSLRSQYSMKVGDHWIEYGRIDPLATLIGIGADLYQFEKAIEDSDLSGDPSIAHRLASLADAGWSAITTNIMSKTYLQGLQAVSQLAKEDTQAQGLQQIAGGLLQRFAPMGGIQKGMSSEANDQTLQTTDPADWWEQMKNQYVSSYFFANVALHERRDGFIGQPVEYDRVAGIKVSSRDEDPLYVELARLSFQLPKVPGSIGGVRLTGDQQHRLLVLMGDTKLGDKTLPESLRDYVTSPEWSSYTDYQKVEVMKVVRQDYYDNAKAILVEEERGLQIDAAALQFQRELRQGGTPDKAIPAQVQAFKEQLSRQ
ncbi:hypothetical protein [Caulobacter sp. DWR2-3-1b2]|uniref:hypothetical protein n=1 Tax=unclassified Caulobacter TaxID=2648921 RepID=UPI003CF3EF22